jgi:cyclic pyranopterin phosphate synthase
MKGINDEEILDFVELTKEKPIEVRFIEYMPFEGNKWNDGKFYSYRQMIELITKKFKDFDRIKSSEVTSYALFAFCRKYRYN